MGSFLQYITGRKGPSGFGSATTAEEVAAGVSLSSYTAIVTGATSGIGFEAARVLVKQGAQVVIPVRRPKSGEEVREKIVKEFPAGRVLVLELDLSSFASIRKFAADFKALNLPLNILINNAGMLSRKFALSEDGFELVFATNHLGPFLLVELLMDDLIKTAQETGIEGRIVNVASEGHKLARQRGFVLSDEKSFRWWKAYGQSKLANILHARYLTTVLQEKKANVTANSLHPGAINTKLGRDFNSFLTKAVFFVGAAFTKSVPQGAATIVYVATHPSVQGVSGKYFLDCNEAEAEATANAKDMKLAEELWNFSLKCIREPKA